MKDKYGYEVTGGLRWELFRKENIKEDSMRKLNFGCGEDIRKGWDNFDLRDFDFDKLPYPIKDDTYDYILAKAIIEHLLYPKKALKELCRITKNKGIIEIIVPYYNNYNSYNDIEHLHHFNERAFRDLKIEGLIIKRLKLVSSKTGLLIPFRSFFARYFNGLIRQIYIEYEVSKGELMPKKKENQGSPEIRDNRPIRNYYLWHVPRVKTGRIKPLQQGGTT
jgi:SAM-dependent methyltransferase